MNYTYQVYNYRYSSIYNIRKMHIQLFNFSIHVIKSISITYPRDIGCIITNNTLCIVYKHVILLPTRRQFLKQVLLSLNRLNNNRALFKARSPIKILSKPYPGLRQSLTLIGYSTVLT